MDELEQLREKARAMGLDRLADDHLRQLARAIAGMDRLVQRLPRNLPMAQEAAHVFCPRADAP